MGRGRALPHPVPRGEAGLDPSLQLYIEGWLQNISDTLLHLQSYVVMRQDPCNF